MEEQAQSQFKGWAVVEIYGHSKAAGFVTSEYFGSACMFRVDVPDLPEREYVLTEPEYAEVEDGVRRWCPAGTKVKRPARPARSRLLGPGSIFSLNPCSEEAARRAIEAIYPRPLIALEIPERPQLSTGDIEPDGTEDDDDPDFQDRPLAEEPNEIPY